MNILLLTSVFSFVVIILPFWFMPYLTPKSIQFGVRIPREFENDPAISSVRKSFHNLILVAVIILFFLLILLPSLLGLYELTLFAMPAAIVFTYLPYYRSFRRLHLIKMERGWYDNRIIASSAFYSADSGTRKSLPGFIFLIPAIVIIIFTVFIGITIYTTLPGVIPTHFGTNGLPDQYSAKSIGSVFTGIFVQIGITLLMSILGYAIVRTGQTIDVSRPNMTFEQQERFKWYTRDALYLFAASINMTNMFSSFATWQIIGSQYMLPLILVPVFAGTSVLLIVVMSFGQMGSRLRVPGVADEDTGLTNRNDDRDWKGGVVNYNKQSSAILVPKRFGIGWTLNLANPKSWIILVLIIGLPLVLIVVGVLIH